jgi:hypothetical protein
VRTTDLLFRGNCAHDNLGPGIWTDIENRNSLIVSNYSFKNSGAGIFHEISGAATILDNFSGLNGSGENSPWGSQILISGSINTLVWRNRVQVARNYGLGIFVVEEGRQNVDKIIHDFPEYVSRGNVIMGNEITFDGGKGASGFFSSRGNTASLVATNRFENNDIIVLEGEPRRFRVGAETLDLAEAQSRGQELNSQTRLNPSQSFTTPTCPVGIGRKPTAPLN